MTFRTQQQAYFKRLVDDEPGQHTYKYVCRHCGIERGPEFTTYHMVRRAVDDPDPISSLGVCPCNEAIADSEAVPGISGSLWDLFSPIAAII